MASCRVKNPIMDGHCTVQLTKRSYANQQAVQLEGKRGPDRYTHDHRKRCTNQRTCWVLRASRSVAS